MYRCINDVFGYCKTEPDWDKPPETICVKKDDAGDIISSGHVWGGTCKSSPINCPKFMTLTELIKSSK
jgi:hypothetical protein